MFQSEKSGYRAFNSESPWGVEIDPALKIGPRADDSLTVAMENKSAIGCMVLWSKSEVERQEVMCISPL